MSIREFNKYECPDCRKSHPVGMNCNVSEVMDLKEMITKLEKKIAALKAKDQILKLQSDHSKTSYCLPPLCIVCNKFHPVEQQCVLPIPMPDINIDIYKGWEEFIKDVQKSTGRDLSGGTANF